MIFQTSMRWWLCILPTTLFHFKFQEYSSMMSEVWNLVFKEWKPGCPEYRNYLRFLASSLHIVDKTGIRECSRWPKVNKNNFHLELDLLFYAWKEKTRSKLNIGKLFILFFRSRQDRSVCGSACGLAFYWLTLGYPTTTHCYSWDAYFQLRKPFQICRIRKSQKK